MRAGFWRRLPAARARFSAAGVLLGGWALLGAPAAQVLFSAPRRHRRKSLETGEVEFSQHNGAFCEKASPRVAQNS